MTCTAMSSSMASLGRSQSDHAGINLQGSIGDQLHALATKGDLLHAAMGAQGEYARSSITLQFQNADLETEYNKIQAWQIHSTYYVFCMLMLALAAGNVSCYAQKGFLPGLCMQVGVILVLAWTCYSLYRAHGSTMRIPFLFSIIISLEAANDLAFIVLHKENGTALRLNYLTLACYLYGGVILGLPWMVTAVLSLVSCGVTYYVQLQGVEMGMHAFVALAFAAVVAYDKERAFRDTFVQMRLLENLRVGDERMKYVATTSHDLRTPLNAFSMGLDMLSAEDGINKVEEAQVVEMMREAAEIMENTVDNLLLYTRILSKGVPCKPMISAVNLANLFSTCRAVVMSYGSGLSHNSGQVEIQLDIDENVGQYVYTDKGKLQQMTMNLLTNARKFTRSQISLRVFLRERYQQNVLSLDPPGHPCLQASGNTKSMPVNAPLRSFASRSFSSLLSSLRPFRSLPLPEPVPMAMGEAVWGGGRCQSAPTESSRAAAKAVPVISPSAEFRGPASGNQLRACSSFSAGGVADDDLSQSGRSWRRNWARIRVPDGEVPDRDNHRLRTAPPMPRRRVDTTTGSALQEPMLTVEVCDDGPGVSEEEKAKLWNAFSQLQSDEGQGTGLGLYSIRQQCLSLGGTFGVLDNEPRGSIFFFQVPYQEVDKGLVEEAAAGQRRYQKGSTDDHRVNSHAGAGKGSFAPPLKDQRKTETTTTTVDAGTGLAPSLSWKESVFHGKDGDGSVTGRSFWDVPWSGFLWSVNDRDFSNRGRRRAQTEDLGLCRSLLGHEEDVEQGGGPWQWHKSGESVRLGDRSRRRGDSRWCSDEPRQAVCRDGDMQQQQHKESIVEPLEAEGSGAIGVEESSPLRLDFKNQPSTDGLGAQTGPERVERAAMGCGDCIVEDTPAVLQVQSVAGVAAVPSSSDGVAAVTRRSSSSSNGGLNLADGAADGGEDARPREIASSASVDVLDAIPESAALSDGKVRRESEGMAPKLRQQSMSFMPAEPVVATRQGEKRPGGGGGGGSACQAGRRSVAGGGGEEGHHRFCGAQCEGGHKECHGKRTVLVVDDVALNIMLMAKMLSLAGHEVHIAKNGMEGLEMMKQRRFSLVLMDIQMPVMTGWECVQLYRAWEVENRPGWRQRIDALTANAPETDATALRCQEVGMDGYFMKPFKRDQLLKRVAACPEVD